MVRLITRIKKGFSKKNEREAKASNYLFMNPFYIDDNGELSTKELDASEVTANKIDASRFIGDPLQSRDKNKEKK